MRIVLLVAHTFNGEVQHRYVAKILALRFPDELAAIIVAKGVNRTPLEKAKRWLRRYSGREIASRLVARVYRWATKADERRQQTFREVLFPEGEDGEMPGDDIVRRVPSHNGPECLALLNELKPDLVAVYGTLVISKKVIAASNLMINIHTGFSPIYRGSDTVFWPLHNGELEYVGVTVHRLDAGIDSGAILARGKPSIEPGDDENRLFAKAVKLGAELLCRAVRREMRGVAKPLAQDLTLGKEYRTVDRTLAAELKTRRLLKLGGISEARAEWLEEF